MTRDVTHAVAFVSRCHPERSEVESRDLSSVLTHVNFPLELSTDKKLPLRHDKFVGHGFNRDKASGALRLISRGAFSASVLHSISQVPA